MNLIKQFRGNSNSLVYLVETDTGNAVYKTNLSNARLCAELLDKLPFSTPEIYEVGDDYILMQHLPGLEMNTYITYAAKDGLIKLIDFLVGYIDYSLSNSIIGNFKKPIADKITKLASYIDINDVADRIDCLMPKGPIHGDLTLENIIFYNNKFYFIDTHHTELNSIVFDANKLRQDLHGLWFVRNQSNLLNYAASCHYIYKQLQLKFNDLFNDDIYVFMLARVLPYCKQDADRQLILSEIHRCR